jgi:hypothetical protein
VIEILCNNAGGGAAGRIDDDEDDDDDGGAAARVNKMCTLIQNLELPDSDSSGSVFSFFF